MHDASTGACSNKTTTLFGSELTEHGGSATRGGRYGRPKLRARLIRAGDGWDVFTHRRLADCHAVIAPPSSDARAEAPHAPTSALDRAAITTTLSATPSITITTNHSVVAAAATALQPVVTRRFPYRVRAALLAPLELELGWMPAEGKVKQWPGAGQGGEAIKSGSSVTCDQWSSNSGSSNPHVNANVLSASGKNAFCSRQPMR